MTEEIYIISQKYIDGGWNKLVKSQERFWWTKEEAVKWLSHQETWFQQANAVFKLVIDDEGVEKVFDGKDGLIKDKYSIEYPT